jgi:hypothetical protein
MSDALVLTLLVLLFTLGMAYVLACERLKGTQS